MTLAGPDSASDELFSRLRNFFADDEMVELTLLIAWENASSKFNRALRVGSQGLWRKCSGNRQQPAEPRP